MLLRSDDRGVLAIGQLSHSWVCGQLAQVWGNADFGDVTPRDEVVLGAQQHDLGMSGWDEAPPRNAQTGLPITFTEMPLEVSLDQWRDGPRRLASQSRYAALLASMHGCRLYERYGLARAPEDQTPAIRAFLDEQRSFHAELAASLRADPATSPLATEAMIARNSDLVWTWDYLSLALALDWGPRTSDPVPTANGQCELELTPADGPGRFTLQPWPLREASVTVRCEGRRLKPRYDSDEELSGALAHAAWETLEFTLQQR